MHPLFAMPAEAPGPSPRPFHPLADEAAAEGLDSSHLGVTAGPPPLPILLLRAETRPQQEETAAPLPLRIGVLVDARAMPGHRHRLRGTLTLRMDPEAMTLREVELGGLEWQSVRDGGWSRVPLGRGDGYAGRAGQVAAQLVDWALAPEAETTLAAAMTAGAAALTRSAAGFDADAALHERDAARADATEQHRARGLAWAAQQRGNAARQARHAALLLRIAAGLRGATDPQRQGMLLTLAATAARRHDAARDELARRRRDRATAAEAARQARQREAALAARLGAAAPELLAALERLLAARGRDHAAAAAAARALLRRLREAG